MKTAALLLCCLLAATAPLFAPPDIAPFRIPREGETLAPAEPTQIAMRAEVVEITLAEDTAHVEAVFDLENTGAEPETLEVGFPSAAQPSRYTTRGGKLAVEEWGEDGILNFTASVDGAPVATHRVHKPKEGVRHGHEYWLCWTMTVPGAGRSTVKVAYDVHSADVNYVPPSPLRAREVTYVLITGRGWKDAIGSARIVVRPSDGLTLGHVERTVPAPTRRGEGEIEWTFTDFEPDTDVLVRYHVHADVAAAVTRLAAELEQDPDDPALLLDYAENLRDLERWCEAAQAYERLGAYEQEKTWPYRRPQTDYVPPLYEAWRCAKRAGDAAYAADLGERAVVWMHALIESIDGKRRIGLRKILYDRREALEQLIAEVGGK